MIVEGGKVGCNDFCMSRGLYRLDSAEQYVTINNVLHFRPCTILICHPVRSNLKRTDRMLQYELTTTAIREAG